VLLAFFGLNLFDSKFYLEKALGIKIEKKRERHKPDLGLDEWS